MKLLPESGPRTRANSLAKNFALPQELPGGLMLSGFSEGDCQHYSFAFLFHAHDYFSSFLFDFRLVFAYRFRLCSYNIYAKERVGMYIIVITRF